MPHTELLPLRREGRAARPRPDHRLATALFLAASLFPWLPVHLSATTAGSISAPSYDRPLTPEQVREDVAFLRQALEEAHAGLDRYGGRGPTMDRLDALAEDPPTSLSPFTWQLARAVAAIRDGHTRLKWPKAYLGRLTPEPLFMPLAFRASGGRLWVRGVAEGAPAGLVGAEVLAIDGRPWHEVRRELSGTIAADAGLPSGIDRRLEESGEISFRYGELSGHRRSWELTVSSASGPGSRADRLELRDVRLEGIPASQIPRPGPGVDDPWSLSIEGGLAVLRIGHFVPFFYRRADLDFGQLLEESFERIRTEAEALVIDVRGNAGGSEDLVRDLLRHLLNEEFGYYRRAELVRRSFPFLEAVRGPLDLPEPGELKPGAGGGFTLPERIACSSRYSPVADPYLGPLLLLTDEGTFSAAAELASILRSRGRGRIAGSAPGGAYAGNTSGIVVELELPNSGARVRIPTIDFWLDVAPSSDPEIRPDYPMAGAPGQEAGDADPLLVLARAWAQKAIRGPDEPEDQGVAELHREVLPDSKPSVKIRPSTQVDGLSKRSTELPLSR
ncbi:MAG: S41 family peptidase [Holophagales bacterium]|nr:S41 family peptidase [Holophagales bacterium]